MTSDRQMAEHYEDPANREPSGAPRRQTRPTGSMASHVAVRFPTATIRNIKVLADEDGQTVSGWIRSVVDAEVARRLPASHTMGIGSRLNVTSHHGYSFGTFTYGQEELDPIDPGIPA